MMWQALGTCGEPCGAGVGSLEGKLVEAKQRACNGSGLVSPLY